MLRQNFAFLGHDNLFSQIYMTQPEGQTQVIACAQSISLILCLFRLVKCKFTEPLYKSAWYTLSLLIFSTYALSINEKGVTLRKKRKSQLLHSLWLCSSIARYCDIAVIATALAALSMSNMFHIPYCQTTILKYRPTVNKPLTKASPTLLLESYWPADFSSNTAPIHLSVIIK